MRVGTYWQMKKRAGVVGQAGLGKLVARLAANDPALRVHLARPFVRRAARVVLARGIAGVDDRPGVASEIAVSASGRVLTSLVRRASPV